MSSISDPRAGAPAIDDLDGIDRLEALVLLDAIHRRTGRRRFDRERYAADAAQRAAVGRLADPDGGPDVPPVGRGRFRREG